MNETTEFIEGDLLVYTDSNGRERRVVFRNYARDDRFAIVSPVENEGYAYRLWLELKPEKVYEEFELV